MQRDKAPVEWPRSEGGDPTRLATSRPYFSSDEVARAKASASDVSRERSRNQELLEAKPRIIERTF